MEIPYGADYVLAAKWRELHILGGEPSGQASVSLLTTVATVPPHHECTCEKFLKDSTQALLSVCPWETIK